MEWKEYVCFGCENKKMNTNNQANFIEKKQSVHCLPLTMLFNRKILLQIKHV